MQTSDPGMYRVYEMRRVYDGSEDRGCAGRPRAGDGFARCRADVLSTAATL
jgi:hypothetical protein